MGPAWPTSGPLRPPGWPRLCPLPIKTCQNRRRSRFRRRVSTAVELSDGQRQFSALKRCCAPFSALTLPSVPCPTEHRRRSLSAAVSQQRRALPATSAQAQERLPNQSPWRRLPLDTHNGRWQHNAWAAGARARAHRGRFCCFTAGAAANCKSCWPTAGRRRAAASVPALPGVNVARKNTLKAYLTNKKYSSPLRPLWNSVESGPLRPRGWPTSFARPPAGPN